MSNPSKGKEIEFCDSCEGSGIQSHPDDPNSNCYQCDGKGVLTIKDIARNYAKYAKADDTYNASYYGFLSGVKFTRQSPQINIDELTGVIERFLHEESLIEFVSGGILDHNQAAKLIAQAIKSHLNGKGDGDE